MANEPTLEQLELLPVSMKMRGKEVMLANEEMAAVIAAVRQLVRNGLGHPEIVGSVSFQHCANVLQKLDVEVDERFGRGILHD